MALADNTETLEQILEEVYALPNRSSGAKVDASIFISTEIGSTPLDFTINDIEYDETEIVNLANKVINNESVNVQISGDYYYYSGGGYFGRFTLIHVECRVTELHIGFGAMNFNASDGFVLYDLEFYLDGDWSNKQVNGVDSAYLNKIQLQTVTE